MNAHPAVPFSLDHYAALHDLVRSWRNLGEIPEERLPAPADGAACARLLAAEARLLDAGRLADWLALFTADCAYWLPTDVTGEDPAKFVAWEFNDRRRLEERVERLATGRAYSQAPPTRTVHLLSGLEMLTDGPDGMQVLANFLIQTNFAGRVGQRAGWTGYLLRRQHGRWRIALKRINLFDADLPQDNNSFTL